MNQTTPIVPSAETGGRELASSERETLRLRVERLECLLDRRAEERDSALRLAEDLRDEQRQTRRWIKTRLYPELAICKEYITAAARGPLESSRRRDLDHAVLANARGIAVADRLSETDSVLELSQFHLDTVVAGVAQRLTNEDLDHQPRVTVYSPGEPVALYSGRQALELSLSELFDGLLEADPAQFLTVDVCLGPDNSRRLLINADQRPPTSVAVVLESARQSVEQLDGRLTLSAPGGQQGLLITLDFPESIGVGSPEKPGENEQLERFARDLRTVMLQRNEALSRVQQTELDGLLRLAAAAEHKDSDTGAHVIRMGHFSAIVARQMGLGQRASEHILYASRMHDVGKIGIPDHILKKPGKLEPLEMEVMRTHPEIGAALLSHSDSPIIQMAQQIALCHHERFDGSGYPRGLKGDEIPMTARIVALTDYFDALTMDRCYRPAMSLATVEMMIREACGSHFDPEVVEAFFRALPTILEAQRAINEGGEPALPG